MDYDSIVKLLRVKPEKKVDLDDFDPDWGGIDELADAPEEEELRDRARAFMEKNRADLAEAQELLWADDRRSVLVILQAMDAAGKDGTIKHVMSGVNPTGCGVVSFKAPSAEELDHTFLWRAMKALPERGKIVIFNRSYYEDVLVVRVHPELLQKAKLPEGKRGKGFWRERFEDINNLERHLVRNGTVVLKFFLNVSKAEQKKRFLERLSDPEKHWKFSHADLAERAHWDDYREAFEEMLEHTSTEHAPWFVIPADRKWVMRTLVAGVLTRTIRDLGLEYPRLSDEERARLDDARRTLAAE
ncbi:MAG TPA: polyphosphate--nucleotide phosphotransferase [Phycisphaerales bacterium]|nr:polyphosphate--nucleotide phosphotransferase [Phycisphaerales bacterium]